MRSLKLNFIPNHLRVTMNPIEDLLHEIGSQIGKYARGYFNYVVTTSEEFKEIKEATLYILAPEIDYDYKILTLEYQDISNVKMQFFPLDTIELQNLNNVRIFGLNELESKLFDIIDSSVSNDSLGYLVKSIHFRRHKQIGN